MARDVTDITRARSRQLQEDHPWIWLYEVAVPGEKPSRYRLTNYDRPVHHGTDGGGAPLEYTPVPIVNGDIIENSEADLPRLQIQIGNEGLYFRQVLEDNDGLIGQPVVLRLVNMLELGDPNASLRFDAQIVGCSATLDRVTWEVSALSLTQAVIPAERYQIFHCRFRYGGLGCGYDLTNATLAAAFPNCLKTLDECRLRGNAEVAAGLVRKHPARFGGWPGIPRVSRK